MLFGCGYELGGCDRAFLRVRPACERFGTDDLAGAEIELRLIGDPHFSAVDCGVQLAQNRQLPRCILQTVRIVIFPLQPVVGGFFGRDQGAGEAIWQ